jgi:2-polyprenyl-3-methyl-5-hydroxy-6-metoxy-1,4-benzoquinol methylase
MSAIERAEYLTSCQSELRFLATLEEGAILDVGCGPGWFLAACGNWVKVGTEVCERAAQAARKHAAIYPDLALISQRFDVVRAHHVIEHMDQPVREIRHIASLTKPGGWLIIGTPDFGSPCAARFRDNFRMLHDETHCSLFTGESLHRFVRDHGFEVIKLEYPFPERYATRSTWEAWGNTDAVSPPWPGNWITLYCQRKP